MNLFDVIAAVCDVFEQLKVVVVHVLTGRSRRVLGAGA